MMMKKLFPTSRMFGNYSKQTDQSELDRPIHRQRCHGRKKNGDNNIPLDVTIDCTIDHSCASSDLDTAVHGRQFVAQPSCPNKQSSLDCSELDKVIHIRAPYQPHTKAANKSIISKRAQFEKNFRAIIDARNSLSSDILIDDIYHDDCIHMMDGLPMNKSALKKFYATILNDGTEQTIEKLSFLDDTHVDAVIRSMKDDMSFVRRSLITLQDGKIIRVEKIAPPPAEQMKSFGAVAA